LCLSINSHQTAEACFRAIKVQWDEACTHGRFRLQDIDRLRGASAGTLAPPRIILALHDRPAELHFDAAVGRVHSVIPPDGSELTIAVVTHGAEAIGIELDASAGCYEEWEIQAHAANLQCVFEAIAGGLPERVADIPIVSREGQQALLALGEDRTVEPADSFEFVHRLIAERARRIPTAVAIKRGEQRLTYQELDLLSDRVASALRAEAPGELIAIFGHASMEVLIALLGILKAGSAYLALDPQWPPQRLAFMLDDSNASVLLTVGQLPEELRNCTARMLDLQQCLVEPQRSPTASIHPDRPVSRKRSA
jgi:non-ribosomal peptide synthetase component F